MCFAILHGQKSVHREKAPIRYYKTSKIEALVIFSRQLQFMRDRTASPNRPEPVRAGQTPQNGTVAANIGNKHIKCLAARLPYKPAR